MSHQVALFPGSFDPITVGHVDIIRRALPIFDKIIIGVGTNSEKKALFSLEKRMDWIQRIFQREPKIEIVHFQGLTAEYCVHFNIQHIIRGIRNAADFDYEKTISQINYTIGNKVDTLFFISLPEYGHISSTLVREIIKGKGDVSYFVPAQILNDVSQLG